MWMVFVVLFSASALEAVAKLICTAGGRTLKYRASSILGFLIALLFCAPATYATISVISISVPEEIAPGDEFYVGYTLAGTSPLAVAELRFYIGNSPVGPFGNPAGTFGPLNESYQLHLIGSWPSYGPPPGPLTTFIRFPTSLQSYGCFPSGTWYFILVVDSLSQGEDSFVVAPISISSFTPQSGPPCTPVTLDGNKFVDVSGILFNGTPAGGTFVNDSTITTSVPPGATTGYIELVSSCGGNPNAQSASPFYVTPIVNPTTISGFTPATAPVDAVVRISGESFTGNTQVYFDATPAARNVIDSQTMDAQVPAGATDGPITVGTGCEGFGVSSTSFIVDPYCYSSAFFLDASRVDSVRFGPLEYVNDDVPGCVVYTNNTDLEAHVFPGQTGLPIEIRQGSCDAANYYKVTKLFADWNSDDDFADAGEEVLAGPPAGSGLLLGSFDIPPSAPLGTTRMRIVTAETTVPGDVTACGVYAGGETQDYTLEISACAGSLDLPPDLWHMISLPCDPGISNTVQDLFADDLTGVYGVDWGLFKFDAVTQQYSLMNLGDTVQTGRGYWLKTLNSGQSVGVAGLNPLAIGVHGLPNSEMDTALVADPVEGRSNLVGFPFTSNVDWADVEVIDGAGVLTLAAADPAGACQGPNPLANGCVMSRIAHKWNGAAYDAFDGQTPGMEGTLGNFDGLWVKAFKSGISLRIPDQMPMSAAPYTKLLEEPAPLVPQTVATVVDSSTAAPEKGENGWFIRLIVESGDLRDAGNVLGQLAASRRGYDAHDLEELSPFGNDYLSVVFPHQNWGDQAGDYTSDYHRYPRWRPAKRDRWRFEVWSSDPGAEVTLRWEGPEEELHRSVLVDRETGQRIRVRSGESYTFTMTEIGRSFRWFLKADR